MLFGHPHRGNAGYCGRLIAASRMCGAAITPGATHDLIAALLRAHKKQARDECAGLFSFQFRLLGTATLAVTTALARGVTSHRRRRCRARTAR